MACCRLIHYEKKWGAWAGDLFSESAGNVGRSLDWNRIEWSCRDDHHFVPLSDRFSMTL